MDKDQLDGLLALKVVADKRNFTAAATELGVSPSAISQSIKQLESRLGVTLLSRTTRSTCLTEAGEQFIGQTGPALDQILAALEGIGSFSKKPSGTLRLNMPRLVYPSFLSPLVKSFQKKHPEVTVELFFEDHRTDVVDSGFDAGIRLSDILAQDMVATKLYGPVRFVTAASPNYLDKIGRPKHPKDLLSHNCICIRLGGNRLYSKWEFESKGSEFEVQVSGNLILNDSLVMIQAAIDGAGVIFTTEDAIRENVRSGELEIVLKQYATSSTGFYLYYPKRSQILPKLRAFLDHIKDAREGK